MTLVLDASLALAWCFDDESTTATEAVLDSVSDKGREERAWTPAGSR